MDSRLLWLRTRLKESMESGLLWVGKWVVIIWGGLTLSIFARQLIDDSEIFFNPRYVHFWQDAEAYHLRTEGWKSKIELNHLYGTNRVERYVTHFGLEGIFLPSEEANRITSKAFLLSYNNLTRESEHAVNQFLLIKTVAIIFILIYFPMVVAVRKGQELLARVLCCSYETYAIRKAYFEEFQWKSLLRTVPFTLTIVIVLSYINAQLQLTPEMQIRGITSFEMTVFLVFVSFLEGLWVLILCSVIDVGFITFSINPHHIIWDDVLTLAIMAPILFFVYKNSWITVAAAMVTGLATGIVIKWMARRRERAAPQTVCKLHNIVEM